MVSLQTGRAARRRGSVDSPARHSDPTWGPQCHDRHLVAASIAVPERSVPSSRVPRRGSIARWGCRDTRWVAKWGRNAEWRSRDKPPPRAIGWLHDRLASTATARATLRGGARRDIARGLAATRRPVQPAPRRILSVGERRGVQFLATLSPSTERHAERCLVLPAAATNASWAQPTAEVSAALASCLKELGSKGLPTSAPKKTAQGIQGRSAGRCCWRGSGKRCPHLCSGRLLIRLVAPRPRSQSGPQARRSARQPRREGDRCRVAPRSACSRDLVRAA